MSVAKYSLWLLPAPADRAWLDALVARLAPAFGQPGFVPHVTVQGDLSRPLAEVCELAVTLARALPVLDWPIRGVERSVHFFRTLYLRFERTDAFVPLLEHAARLTGTRNGLPLFPHLSLAYGELDDAAKRPHADTVATEIAGRRVTFDSLAVALSGKGVPIGDWRIAATCPLARTQPVTT